MKRSLRTKLISLFLATSILPLAFMGYLGFTSAQNALQQQSQILTKNLQVISQTRVGLHNIDEAAQNLRNNI